MTSFPKSDKHYMRQALGLARRGLGRVYPNPAVGCVLVKDGLIVGRGFTQPGGRPHAETVALNQAGGAARGATAYVTLEPCAHHGQTGPCAEALVSAGIERAVIATLDPDARVSGKGGEILKAAGITVEIGLEEGAAREVNAGFLLAQTSGRPMFSLKMATSRDGKIATENGDSKWITGDRARAFGHMLRANHDGILVGAGTVLADNPVLDCRIPGLESRSPIRIILDSNLKTPLDSRLVGGANEKAPVWIFCQETVSEAARNRFVEKGAKVFAVPDVRNLEAVARRLASEGLTRILVEGGGQVHASFMAAGLADRLYHFTASKIIGGDGIDAVASMGLDTVERAPIYNLREIRRLGPDLLASFAKPE